MRIRLGCLLLFGFIFSISIWAGNTLTVRSENGKPGDEVTITIALDNTDTVAAIELFLPLPEALTYVEGSCQLNTDRAPSHELTAVQVNQTLKIYLYSLKLDCLSGTSGELLTFRLKLGKAANTYQLTPTVVMSDSHGNAIDTHVNSSSITVMAPELTIETPKINYGHVPIRSNYIEKICLFNSGNLPLTISNIYDSKGWVMPSQSSFIMQAGQRQEITLSYSPTERGPYSTDLHVISNAINGTDQVIRVVADPFSINEIHVMPAQGISDGIATISMVMKNMEPIVAMECTFELPDQLAYVEKSVALSGRSVNHIANASYTQGRLKLYVYSPDNTAFKDNDGELLSFDLRLNGKTGSYNLNPQNVVLSNKGLENMISATYSGNVTIVSPSLCAEDTLDFGSRPINHPVEATYHVTNVGAAPLVIDRITFLEDGFQTKTALPLTVPAGQTRDIELAYIPQHDGYFSTTMNLYSNDPSQRLKQINLSGKVFEPNGLTMVVDTLDDGNAWLRFILDNYSDVVALQFDITGIIDAQFDSKVQLAQRLSNHQVVVSGNSRILVYSPNNTPIDGKYGEIFAIKLLASHPITTTLGIDSVVISDTAGINRYSLPSDKVFITYGVKYYRLIIAPTAHGQVHGKAGKYADGTELSLTAVPNEGYKFVAWNNGSTGNPLVLKLTSDTTLTATFTEEIYRLVFMIDREIISESLVPYGTPIVFIQAPDRPGYSFEGWTAEVNNGDPMPAHDVIVTGEYHKMTSNAAIPSTTKRLRVYTLGGTFLPNTESASDFENLPQGVYIIDGKKVLKIK